MKLLSVGLLLCALSNRCEGTRDLVASGCHKDGGALLECPVNTSVSLVGSEYYYQVEAPNACSGGGCGLLFHKGTEAGDKHLAKLAANCSGRITCKLNPPPMELPAYCGENVLSQFILVVFRCPPAKPKERKPKRYPMPKRTSKASRTDYMGMLTGLGAGLVAMTTWFVV